jgi:polyferredoxin
MTDLRPWQWLADAVLTLHAAVVVFVIGGLVVVAWGYSRGWRLSRSLAFRVAHLAAVAVIVGQAWLGEVCPLTTLEMWLRDRARAETYGGSFIENWVQRLIYYDVPAWVFTLAYTVFGVAVAVTWWRLPPTRASRRRRGE